MGSEARARLGLAGLLATTLFGFGGLFEPGDYFGPGLLAMLFAGSIAMATRRLGLGTLVTLVASAGALLAYTTFVFASGLTFYGLPTPAAITDVIDAVSRALAKAEVDTAPVPVRAGYVVLMVAGMWAATTLGEIATFRWKRPVLAAVPAIGLFSMLIVVGVERAATERALLFLAALVTYWGLEASHRLRSWGRWVPTWTGIDDDQESTSVTGAIARRLGAACVAVAIAAPLFTPALGDGLLSWRSGSGSGGGGGRIDPFVSLAPNLLSQSNTVLFRVRADRPAYWRLLTLPNFDGTTWRPSSLVGSPIVGGAIPEDTPEDAPLQELTQSVAIHSLEGDALPAAPQPTSITIPELQDDVLYRPTGDVLLEDLHSGLSYTVVSRVPDYTYEELRSAPVGLAASVYTDLPGGGLSPAVEALRDRWIAGADTPYEQLVAIQENLRGPAFTYSTQPAQSNAREGASADYLTTFLTDTRAGYCQQFSAAFAVLARSLNHPTRVAIGFLPGAKIGDVFTVSGTDAHAWPEVYFEGIGWVAFEPTPRADGRTSAAPTYTLPDLSGPGPDSDGGTGEGGGIGPSPVQVREGIPPGGRSASLREPPPPAGGLGASGAADWQRTFTRLAVTLAVLTVLFLIAVPTLKTLRIRRLYARAHGSRDRAAAAFEAFLLEAAELATARGPAETANAYVRRLLGTRPLPEESALALVSIYNAATFARRDLPDAEAARARRLARELRTTLWGEAPWWQRAVRMFSPASLTRREVAPTTRRAT